MSGLLNMLLANGDRIRLDSTSYFSSVIGGSVTTEFKIDSDGLVYARDNTSGGLLTARYPWIIPQAAAANYDVRWNTTSNTVDSTPGAENTNLNLGTDRTWSETAAGSVESCAFSARIHRVGNTANPIVTATITLEADGSP
jgi:hypothetical protein